MGSLPWRDPPLTEQEEHELVFLTLLDDVIEPTWSFGGDLQFWAASSFAHSLRNYAREFELPWYVACMLPIAYSDRPLLSRKLIAPDTLVAFAPDHPREAFDAAAEGCFPPFIVEVVAPSSEDDDRYLKRDIYQLLGAQEYVLFTPIDNSTSTLEGYCRDTTGAFVPWQADPQGRLWSDVLGLFLVARGPFLQGQTQEGRLLLTPDQAADELRRLEEARLTAEAARKRAEEARLSAEQETERLKRELERYRNSE